MKKICIVTATRAEYGLLSPVIKKLDQNPCFDVLVIATGAHLSPEFGLTYREIEKDKIVIDQKIEILMSSDTPVSISKSMGLAMISFAEYFDRTNPDMLIVLGDRYETLAVCCAAMNAQIPIAHLYGGETTEGAIDESIRHAITKMSYLHFTSTEEYRKRVIQLGEAPERVFKVGAMGVENILSIKLLSKEALEASITLKLDKPYAVITFHPVTLEKNQVEQQFDALLSACDAHPEMQFIFTKANSDAHGRIINQKIDDYACKHKNAIAFESLGMLRYLSALKYAQMVIGNSSSGLIEVPSFHIPTINIGDRQKGRIQGKTVINCVPEKNAVLKAMDQANDPEFRESIQDAVNPYGDGKTSDKMSEVLTDFLMNDRIDLKKKFYDIEVLNV
ncbi:UDP-N-acetylglucosamine 2-epimerase (hydrolyzing) [Eubacterium sp. AM05-23]|uniref:UDP-N-acetylglucosamine 2-epimerase n=1 Tax=Eubacterium TaxID=1730 RepID=UPI000E549CE7|nr:MULTISPECIES: UDP-N-acetylglucosamine 2-epimerase [Eubacterium]RHO57299.1 UDP-N-acetylglucosamine 2-epimerase (hydrolyzing) [Eubacterium sp. AM05-23]